MLAEQRLYTAFLLVVASTLSAEYSHNQFRQYTCIPSSTTLDVGKNSSLCALSMLHDGEWLPIDYDEERNLDERAECFVEQEQVRGQLREYCPLHCVDAVAAYVDVKRPNDNRFCVSFFSYNVIRRSDDYYLWRQGECLGQEIQFDIGCTFPFKERRPSTKPRKNEVPVSKKS